MAATMKDVAELAGVSVGTVSHVLNRPHLVSAKTAQRVQVAVSLLDYVRSEPARQLRMHGRSDIVVLLVPDLSAPEVPDLLSGALRAAQDAAVECTVISGGADADHRHQQTQLLVQRRVRGVLLLSSASTTDTTTGGEGARELHERGTPVVLAGAAPSSGDFTADGLSSVSIDERAGGRLVGQHLDEGGHRRVLVVARDSRNGPEHERLEGLRQALPHAQLHTVDVPHWQPGEPLAPLRVWLGAPPPRRPTAVFAFSDLLALEVLAECRAHHLSVPGQIAVVGCGDAPFTRSVATSLTTLAQPHTAVGRQALELLLSESEAEEAGEHGERCEAFLVPPRLLLRASSAIARRKSVAADAP